MSDRDEGVAVARGCLVALPVGLLMWAVIAGLVCIGCSSEPGPAPQPAPSTSSSSSSSATRERDAIDEALDRAWDEHDLGCALPTTVITDTLYPVVQSVVETDRLTAVLAAQQYRRDRCGGS